jgi:hypothetical protein
MAMGRGALTTGISPEVLPHVFDLFHSFIPRMRALLGKL